MKRVTLIGAALVVAVLAVLSGRLLAQETNTQERTFLTFSGAVEMPGVTLQPGTYVFKLADTQSRNVVQVFDKDEKDIIGQWLFVQAERPMVTSENVIMFKESPEGTTPAVQYWYFPGEKIGKEFVYPKDQGAKIAQRTGQRVLTTDGELTATSSVSSVDAQGKVTEWQREQASASASANADANASAESTQRNAPAPAQPSAAAGSLAGNRGVTPPSEQADTVAPAPREVEIPSAVGTSGQAPARAEAQDTARPAQVARADELPRTASPLPLSGLLGLLSLAGALGVRAWRQ